MPQDVTARLVAAFGSVPKADAAAPAVQAAPRVEGRRVLLVDKPGATQTYFWLGNVGASRTDPERTAQSVVNTVFGGRFTSMLNTELRIKSGLTYGARSGFDRLSAARGVQHHFVHGDGNDHAGDRPRAGDARSTARRRPRRCDAAIRAKTYLQGQFPPTIETNGQLAGRLAELLFYGLGSDDVDEFAARVAAVDGPAVRAVIDRSFPRSRDLAVVLIGDAARIRDAARKLGPVTEMKITDPRFAPL